MVKRLLNLKRNEITTTVTSTPVRGSSKQPNFPVTPLPDPDAVSDVSRKTNGSTEKRRKSVKKSVTTKKSQKEVHKSETSKRNSSSKSETQSSVHRKKRRYRPGTKALMEIRRYQKTVDTMIPKRSFGRLVLEILQSYGHYRIQSAAVAALQAATEAWLTGLLEMTNIVCIHRGRTTIHPKDMRLVRRIRGDFI